MTIHAPQSSQNTVGLTLPRETVTHPGETHPSVTKSCRKRKCSCGHDLSDRRRRTKYCSSKCKQKAYRKRQPKTPKKARELNHCTCQWCDHGFFSKSKSAKYCTPYHRQLAYHQRREAALSALAEDLKISHIDASNLLEILSMQKISKYLVMRGFAYDDWRRSWISAQEQNTAFHFWTRCSINQWVQTSAFKHGDPT